MNSATTALLPKKDKYEQIRAKYDWESPFPPSGYQYGVGRGAKAFTTSAELSAVSVGTTPQLVLGPEQTAMLEALDRIEEGRRKRRREEDSKSSRTTSSSLETKPSKVMLSMEDIATIGSGCTAQSLVKRKARTDDMEVVDSYAFADETAVVTASDLLRSRALASSQTLENILDMGSSTEQTTWITHSRAFREMGMLKKAQHTLVEGCRLTGDRGPLIWKERLQYLHDPASQRQLLEEAVKACRSCEELWLLLLEREPPHEQLHWLQQAVIACPASEVLWIRILGHVVVPRDQKKIIRKALEVTPNLPSLWAMLARLEGYETGKAIFNAAVAEYPSLKIIIEASKFEEFHLATRPKAGKTSEEGETQLLRQLCSDKIRSMVQQASIQFLAVEEEKSRREWLETARSSAVERYIATSAYMYLFFVCDKKATQLSPPATWIDDLTALVPDMWQSHEVLCAVWAAVLILRGKSSNVLRSGSGDGGGVTEREVQVMESALRLAPLGIVGVALSVVLQDVPLSNGVLGGCERVPDVKVKEEEEEELPRPVETVSVMPPANTLTTSATAASEYLPLPLTFVIHETLMGTAFFSAVEVLLCIAKVLYDRRFYEDAFRILSLGVVRHPTCITLFTAAAKARMAMGHVVEAEKILTLATSIVPAKTDTAWVKLAVHLRSREEDIVPLLEKAVAVFPQSERLWLMRLEAEGMRVRRLLDDATVRGLSTAPFISDLRRVYGRALSEAHCQSNPTVWCYAAVNLESNLLSDAAAARTLLLEGAVVCERYCNQQQPYNNCGNRRAEIQAEFGLARCNVELTHGACETALEVVRETLQQLPKRNGSFTIPVGQLVALSIDLEAPCARGRAAAQAVQCWRVRDPLVLGSVAKLYHSAGKHEKALDQALKAVKMSLGRCGDVVALWLKLSLLPVYKCFVLQHMGMPEESESAKTESLLSVHVLLRWLWGQLASHACGANNVGEVKMDGSSVANEGIHAVKPNSGPLWVLVSKSCDPSNVTLLGYRDSIELMLGRVMDLIKL
ncbi:hypothetical protein TRVL_04840 [Trypanosoma vivax]|nr:hypothetical protein TRVL_04840 [Trypanosoma vivax]